VRRVNGPISAHPDTYIWVRSATLDFYAPGRLDRALAVPLQVERKDPALETAVPAGATMERLADGFTFTEGPVWVPDRGRMGGGYLLFSDPDNNVIYRMSPWGEVSVYLTHSGYAGEDTGLYRQAGSNGRGLDSEGRLTFAQHGNRRVARLERNGLTTVLADRFEGRRLNSPNDLVYRSDGALFFTDPPFGLPKVHEDPRRELPHSGVYSVKDGKVRLVAADLRGPNGLAFSPEERFLYVGNWDEKRKVVQRYPVHADATLGAGEPFHDFTRVAGEDAIDGLKVDRRGNVYVSGPGGLWVLSPEGKALGLLKGPEHVHNMAWGDADYRSLYLAARSGIYRLRLPTPGSGSFDRPPDAMAHSPLR